MGTTVDALPTHDELCVIYGFRKRDDEVRLSEGGFKPRPMSVHAASEAEGWLFAMTARSRGWVVSDPMHNGMPGDNHFITVWQTGVYDDMAKGRYRRTLQGATWTPS